MTTINTKVSAMERRIQRWDTNSTDGEKLVAAALVGAISATREDLSQILEAVLPAGGGIGTSIDRLLERPFVEKVANGFRVTPEFRQALLPKLSSHKSVIEACSRHFIELERVEQKELAGTEREWFVKGRIAYYLAPLDPGASSEGFVKTLLEASPYVANDANAWLSELALGQQYFLKERNERTISFFTAFRCYRMHAYEAAAEGFLRVVNTSETEDSLLAISLHLWAVAEGSLRRGRYAKEEIAGSMKRAVEISQNLGLVENEIMSRNSLVFNMLEKVDDASSDTKTLVAEAARLASKNYQVARSHEDSFLERWTIHARTVTKWMDVTFGQLPPVDVDDLEAEGIEADCYRAIYLAKKSRDWEAVVATSNSLLCILRDRGDLDRAMEEVSSLFHFMKGIYPPSNWGNLGKTLGSMRRYTSNTQEQSLDTILETYDNWDWLDA